jgi:HAE1 family hydrophobic/amphiphilic exporter-1
MLLVYGGLIGLTYLQFARAPSGFIPQLDRAYFIAAISLPPGASLERTDATVRRASEILLTRPGVAHAVSFAGFDGATFTNAPNSGVVFVTLKPFEERVKAGLKTDAILNDLRGQMQALREAFVLVIPPPSVPGIGTGGGFKLYVQDRAGRGRAPRAGCRRRPRARQRDAGPSAGVHAVQHLDATGLCRHRSHQGRDAGRADHALLRLALDLYGLDLHQ